MVESTTTTETETTTTTTQATTTTTDNITINQLPKTATVPVAIPAGMTIEELTTLEAYVVDATILEAAIGNN